MRIIFQSPEDFATKSSTVSGESAKSSQFLEWNSVNSINPIQQSNMQKIWPTLRILGPSNGRVWTCIAGVWVLKIATFEGSGFLGQKKNILIKGDPRDCQ